VLHAVRQPSSRGQKRKKDQKTNAKTWGRSMMTMIVQRHPLACGGETSVEPAAAVARPS